MKATVVLGPSHTGSTKYGEHLTEKFNQNGEKTIFVGEGIRKEKRPYNAPRKTLTHCSCENKYEACPFWKEIDRQPLLIDLVREIVAVAKDLGYEHIIDTSKDVMALHGYQEILGPQNVHCVWKDRNPIGWVHSKRKKIDEPYTSLLVDYASRHTSLFKRAVRRAFYRGNLKWERNRRYDLQKTYSDHKHIMGGNPNKFDDVKSNDMEWSSSND